MGEGEAGTTLGALLRETRAALEAAGIDGAAQEARLLVEGLTATTRTDSLARPEQPIAQEAVAAVRDAVSRRLGGEPVHRILGWREFYGLQLALSPATLEPRPDTEIVVDRLIPYLKESVRMRGMCRILDLGTGTGAIALALLSQLPEARAVGADIEPEAVETARRNAEKNGVAERFEGLVSDWFSGVTGKFHAIVANPPYISADEMASLPPEVRLFDPHKALYGGSDGLDAYRKIADGAPERLEPDGILAVEIGHRQRESVTHIFQCRGLPLIEAATDLAGRDRALVFSAKPETLPNAGAKSAWQSKGI